MSADSRRRLDGAQLPLTREYTYEMDKSTSLEVSRYKSARFLSRAKIQLTRLTVDRGRGRSLVTSNYVVRSVARRVRRSNPSRHASRPGPRAEMRANTRKDEATPRARALRDTSTIRSHTTGAAPWSPTQPRLLAPRPRACGRRVMHLLCAPDVGLFNRCCPTRSRWATGTRTRRSPVWATGAWT